MLRKILLGSVAALFVVGAATAQMWMDYPVVGGSSFCSSTANSTCVNTVPAGPALTGLSTVPVDTNAPGGRSPQTAKAPVAVIGLGGLQNIVPTNGQQHTINPGVGRVIFTPAGAVNNIALVFPPATSLYDGQVLIIVSSQTITTLSLLPSAGTTLAETPTAVGAATPIMFIYSAASNIWYLIGNQA